MIPSPSSASARPGQSRPVGSSETKVDITLRHEIIRGSKRLTDGVHHYWTDALSGRVRWAATDWPNDGIGIASHGGEKTLEAAIEAAEASRRERVLYRKALL